MIISLLLYIAGFLLGTLATITSLLTGNFQMPVAFTNGLTYFFTNINTFDFMLNTSELLLALKWFIAFDIIYFGTKLIFKIYNWVRGSGGIEV